LEKKSEYLIFWIFENEFLDMWTIKKKNQVSATYAHLMSWMEEGCFPEKKSFTRMQIKPKIL